MDYFLLFLCIILIVSGIIGCFLPVLPGPPLSFGALLILQATHFGNATHKLLWILGGLAVLVTVLDYVIPVWGTKKWGGSKAGVTGATIGLIIGLFLGPIGIIAGPFLGAVVGELTIGKTSHQALKSGIGSLIGFLLGTALKFALSLSITVIFFKQVIQNF